MTILVTGAAGFIGSNLVRMLRARHPSMPVVSYDALTYAGNPENLATVWSDPRHTFIKGDVTDRELLSDVFATHDVRWVFHLAAESHVDRSILGPMAFVKTNVEGTAALLSTAAAAWDGREERRFVHVSTDEVFGSLGHVGRFDETTPYAPRSPYSASKAASDHMARAWHATYGLPVIVTNCTNNYGPYQFPEKLIPVVITRALEEEPIPVYGDGKNVRDWIYVDDHCAGLCAAIERGKVGETYCLGGDREVSNIDLVRQVLAVVDEEVGRAPGTSERLIQFVTDRPGHDFRYAMDSSKAKTELGWRANMGIKAGLRATVSWYIENRAWAERARQTQSDSFEKKWYAGRIPSTTTDSDPVSGDHQTIELSPADLHRRQSASDAFRVLGFTGEHEPKHTPAAGSDVPGTEEQS